MHADFHHPAIVETTALFRQADGVVIGTPVKRDRRVPANTAAMPPAIVSTPMTTSWTSKMPNIVRVRMRLSPATATRKPTIRVTHPMPWVPQPTLRTTC